MAKPFQSQPVRPPGRIIRALGRKRKANAPVEVENLLAAAPVVTDVTAEELGRVAESYRVNLPRRFRRELLGLYRRHLDHCLEDHAVSAAETAELAHLKGLFGLSDQHVSQVHDELGRAKYGAAVREVLADKRLDPAERDFLERLQKELRLPDEIADRIYATSARAIAQAFLDEAISDGRLSPDEDREIDALAANLGVTLDMDEKTQRELEKLRLFWLIEEGEIPGIDVPINLQRSESCYFTVSVTWYELRRVTSRVRYGGPTARIRIAKGVYWRMGDMGIQRVSEDVMKPIDEGELYLTNKRLIFAGHDRNRTIRLNKVLDFQGFRNGVEIQKETGKSPFLEFDRDVDVFCAMLSRATREATG